MAHIRPLLVGVASLLALPLALACGEYVPNDSATGGSPNGTGGTAPGAGGGVTGTGGTAPTGTGGSGPAACATTVSATETSNLKFTSTITLPTVTVAPNSLPSFDWSATTQNFQKRPLVAGTKDEITSLVLVVWSVSAEQIAHMINIDDPDIEGYTEFSIQLDLAGRATQTAEITEFSAFGNPVKPEEIEAFFDPVAYPPETTTFTLIAQQGYTLGHNAQMIQAFNVDPTATNTLVTMTNDSTDLTYDASLPGGKKVDGTFTQMPAAQPGITMDWSTITSTSFGMPGSFVSNKIQEVIVGRYTQTITEIENDFLNLENLPVDLWRGTVASGTSLDLSTLTHETSGSPFPGVTEDGSTWLVGLLCTDCINPTPWYVSPIQVCQ